ncbi:hypothetical protein [Streptomyces sp. NPDC093149]|uniref:hypothetical protein n=1 Tax=Streptomyces sp. NPDC093149 TaxID=3366031 RepID=UPI0037F4944E
MRCPAPSPAAPHRPHDEQADRLVATGPAVPGGVGTDVAAAVRAVQRAALLVVAMGAAALLMPGQEECSGGRVVSMPVRFGLPLAPTPGCLAIARMEVHPYSSWALPAGRRLLATNETSVSDAGHDVLAAMALRGVRAVHDPALRAALGARRPSGRASPGRPGSRRSGAVLRVLVRGFRGRRRPVPAANPDPNPVSLERRAARNAPAPAV